MKAKRFAFSILVSCVMGFSGTPQALADDTDIYTLPPKFSTDAAPKVLLVFDTSGSMGSDVVSRPDYDASVDYVTPFLAANPTSPLTANRIYWDNRTLNPPSHSSSKWIDVADLNCQAAKDYFATADNIGYFGESSTSSLMVQHRVNSNRRWGSPTWGSRQPIDCIQDSDANFQQTDTSNYLNENNDWDGYTGNSNQAYEWTSTSSYYRVRLYTANYIAYLSNAALKTTRARMRVAKHGLKAVITDNPTVNFGLMAFNVNSGSGSHGGRVIEAVGKPDDIVTYQPTTLDSNASSGDTVVLVDDPRMFSVGEEIGIELNGGGGTHWTTVSSAVETELTAFLDDSGSTFTVADASGFTTGEEIGIEDNDGVVHWRTISGIAGNSITISSAFNSGGEDANETQKVWSRKIGLTAALPSASNNGREVYARGTRLEKIKDTIEVLVANGSTPISESTYEAYRYFAGLGVVYGNPTSTETPPTDKCAQDATCATADGTYISPLKYECEKAYIVMMTDGAPTADTDEQQYLTSGNFPARPATTGQAISSLPGSGSGDGLIPLVEWMNKNDINTTTLANTQTAKFYAVTFGDGVSASAQTLLDTATQKGTGDPTKTATNAEDVSDLQNAFDVIISDIKIESASFGAPTLSVNAFNKLYNRDEVYFALFEPSAKYKWNGNLKKYRLCDSLDATNYGCNFGDIIDTANADVVDLTTKRIKASAHSWWSSTTDGGTVTAGGAGESTNALNPDSQRRLYTWRGTYSGATYPLTLEQVDDTSGGLFDAADPSATAGNPEILGLPAAPATTTADVTNTIGWMMGKDVYDEDGDPSTTTRWSIGDPLHSRPITITYGAHGGDYNQPVIKLLMAGNDGAVRLFNDDSGAEEWAFLPQEMLGNQANLASGADGVHTYGVDNTATVWINDHNNNGIIERPDSDGNYDTVYAYISMRRGTDSGGDSYLYALDITPTSTLTDKTDRTGITPELLWVIKGGTGDFTQLGQTWSAPQVATVRVKASGQGSEERKVLLFGGGYDESVENNAVYPTTPENKVVTKNNSGSVGNAIFMVDALTGSRIWWASSTTATDGSGDNADLALTDMIYPIPSDLALLDSNGDQAIDRIYIGDVGGQLWRIDLSSLINPSGANPGARNSTTKGYVFADLICDRDNTAPYARQCPGTDVPQDWRRIFYAPDVGGVTDTTYVLGGEPSRIYDMVFVATGDRPDPLDRLTNSALSPKQEPVHNAVYALKDPDFAYGPLASAPKPIVISDLHDATANPIESADAATKNAAFQELRDGKGWMVYFKENPDPAWTSTDPVGVANGGATRPWIGEKSLARPVLFGGVVYVTTFTPANASMTAAACEPNEGLGKVYGLNYLDASVVIDLDGDGTSERSMNLGGGIPSELVTVIREDGTTGLVGSSGGATQVGVEDVGGQERTFWYQE